MAAKTVVWAGLDYSMVRMIGTDNLSILYNFTVPDAIFPSMPEKWNQLFLDERVERVSTTIGKRVLIDIKGVTERNKAASKSQIILTANVGDAIDESHITQQDIANEVRSYKMENTNGLGLVFIVDRLIRKYYAPQGMSHGAAVHQIRTSSKAAIYVVFFDIATREVISVERKVHDVWTGGNFRNFWFGPIKDTDSSLGRYRTSRITSIPTSRSGKNQ